MYPYDPPSIYPTAPATVIGDWLPVADRPSAPAGTPSRMARYDGSEPYLDRMGLVTAVF